MLVIVAPGQGSQRPGFLSRWAAHPRGATLLRSYGDLLGLDLVHLGTRAGRRDVQDTAVAQPLLVAAGLLAARLLAHPDDEAALGAGAVAGHSVGEVTAAGVAGVLSEADALRLAAARGTAMAESAAASATGMTAVVGGDADDVRQAIERRGLEVATVNGPGQVVAAGALVALAGLAADPPPGARLVPLAVSGAFHTGLMSPAVPPVRRALAGVAVADPAVPVVSGLDGMLVHSGRDLVARVPEQLVRPVRWDLCTETFRRLGVTGVLELPPAGTLAALARRGLREWRRLASPTPTTSRRPGPSSAATGHPDDARSVEGATMRGPVPHRHRGAP